MDHSGGYGLGEVLLVLAVPLLVIGGLPVAAYYFGYKRGLAEGELRALRSSR